MITREKNARDKARGQRHDWRMLNCVRVLVLLLAGLLMGCLKTTGPEPLRVGMELAYPPFEMTDEQGRPAGVSLDLAQALGAALGRPAEIQNIPFDGLIPALKTGAIDIIISSLTATPERALSIDFSEPYLTTGLAMLVGAKSDVQTVEDLAKPGRTVAVKKGTTGHLFATEKLAPAGTRLLVLDRESAAALEVAQGKADAFLYDQMSVLEHWRKHSETTRPLLTAISIEPWAIGVAKGRDELRAAINVFLRDFRAGGGFERLGEKWLRERKAAFAERGIPFVL